MKTKQVKPSDLKKINELPTGSIIQPIENPEWYAYYYDNGMWYPHRIPTLDETIKNEFSA